MRPAPPLRHPYEDPSAETRPGLQRYEGVPGLYRGFWVSTFQVASGVLYISTYEGVRHALATNGVDNARAKSLAAGGCASLVSQTAVVPFDVLSQHLMVLGVAGHGSSDRKVILNPLGLTLDPSRSRFQVTVDIARRIYARDGLPGFYRGYVASLCAYVPNSALWWTFYHLYQEKLFAVFPSWVSQLFIQCVAGTLGGFTSTLLTNPLDIVRARLQVQGLDSMSKTFHILWTEERLRIFTKGLSARMVQSCFFSFTIILGYETIKRVCINDEYREYVRW
ncbi:solute carrier family 25 member 44 isoform X2 [Bacillus rossius redtenbacheri]|uniref:solute carrier family 25 member 44 isoform X2 n=1 Tax=Bacillus rossius redtenbacheri TaxID=93214 RepID=UPI002FDD7D6E